VRGLRGGWKREEGGQDRGWDHCEGRGGHRLGG
jgi:hypothetical protein